jgi:hypothetical protein
MVTAIGRGVTTRAFRRRAVVRAAQSRWAQQKPTLEHNQFASLADHNAVKPFPWPQLGGVLGQTLIFHTSSIHELQRELPTPTSLFRDALRLRTDARPVPNVELALEVTIGTRPGAHHAEVDACGHDSRQQRRAMTLAVRLDPPSDIVRVPDVMLSAWVTARLVWLVEMDQVAALQRRCGGGACRLGVEGGSAHAPRPAARHEAELSPARPQRPPGEEDALCALRVGRALPI